MNRHLTDTTAAVDAALIASWCDTPTWQKFQMIDELNATLQVLATSDLRRRYPHADAAQLRRRLAARWLGEPLATTVYGSIGGGADAAECGAVACHGGLRCARSGLCRWRLVCQFDGTG